MQFANWNFFSQKIVINLEMLKENTLFSARKEWTFQKVEQKEKILSSCGSIQQSSNRDTHLKTRTFYL